MAQPIRKSGLPARHRPLECPAGTSRHQAGKIVARLSAGRAWPTVSDARQTTTPPVFLEFRQAQPRAGPFRCSVEQQMRTPGHPARSGLASCGVAGHRAQAFGWCAARKLSPKKMRRSAVAGKAVATSVLHGPRQNQRRQGLPPARGATTAAAQTGTQQTLMPQMNEIAGFATITASPDIKSAMPGPPTTRSRLNNPEIRLCRQRGADGEEINENPAPADRPAARKMIGASSGLLANQPELSTTSSTMAGYCDKQAAEQFGPMQHPFAQNRRCRAMTANASVSARISQIA